jgi:hypothetical protein
MKKNISAVAEAKAAIRENQRWHQRWQRKANGGSFGISGINLKYRRHRGVRGYQPA